MVSSTAARSFLMNFSENMPIGDFTVSFPEF